MPDNGWLSQVFATLNTELVLRRVLPTVRYSGFTGTATERCAARFNG